MKRLFSVLMALLMIMPQCSFAATSDELADVAQQIESLLEIYDDHIALPETIQEGIDVKWYSDSDSLVIDGSKALYVPEKVETSAVLKGILTKDGESSEAKINVTVPARDIALKDCAFGEDFEAMSSIPEGWEVTYASQEDISVGKGPSDEDNACLILDNSTSNENTTVKITLDEEVKATGTDPVIILEYKFCVFLGNGTQLMYVYGGPSGNSIPINMNIYSNYAYAQSSEGNLTFLQPWVEGQWYIVRVELDNTTKTFDLYLDGELVLENRGYRISGADSVAKLHLGRPENRKGITYYDYIKVYSDPYYRLDKAISEVSGEGFDNITGSISFPQYSGDYDLRWISSDESIISSDGIVNRPVGEDAHITLTAVIEQDGCRVAKSFDANVIGRVVYDNEDEGIVNNDAETISINQIIAPQDISALTEDFELPVISENGADITWTSADNSAIAVLENGNALVIRGSENKTATITATFRKGGFEVSRDFLVGIKKVDEYTGPYIYSEDFEAMTEFNLEDPRPKYELTLVNGTVQIEQGAGRDGTAGVHLYSMNVDGNNSQIHIYTDDVEGTAIVEADVKNISGAAHNVFYTYGDSGLFANMNMQNRLVIQNGEKQEIGIASLPVNTWYKMRLVCRLNDKVWSLYVDTDGDGVLELIRDNLACRMETAKVNHLLFGGGKNVDFALDNVKLYQDPLFPAQDAAKKLDLGRIDGLEGDMLLPSELEDGVHVSWISSDPDVIATDGKVTRPGCYEEDKTVTLYGIFDKNGYRVVEQYEATVLREKTDIESAEADAEALLLYDINYLTHDLALPLKGQNGTTISWESSEPDVISAEGKLTRPVYNDGKKKYPVLTATVTKNKANFVRKFNVVVPEMNYALDGTASSGTRGAYSFLVVDGDDSTYWSPSSSDTNPYITVALKETRDADLIRIVSDTEPESVEVSDNGHNFEKVKKSFDTRAVKYVRLNFASRTVPKVYEIGLYNISSSNPAAEDAALIDLGDTDEITKDIELPINGKNGSIITWTSSDTNVISVGGKVTRPSSGNKSVVLTALVQNGDARAVRTFNVTIKGENVSSSSGGGGGKKTSGGSISGSVPSQPTVATPVTNLPTGFKDVSEDSWYYRYVEKMAQDKLINGVGNGLFEPERAITRAEFVKVLVSCLDIKERADISFEDVGTGSWYYESISAAYAAGIVNGIDEDRFGPDEKITRQDMAVMVARAIGIESDSGTLPVDFELVADYARASVEGLFAAGVLSGDDAGRFNPFNSATRAEVAKIMYCIRYERGEN